MAKHYNITVIGKVQGVWFRAYIKKIAAQLNITGFVKNLANGSVYIEAEGTETNINEFINYCKIGPEKAEVTALNYSETKIQDFINFKIKRF